MDIIYRLRAGQSLRAIHRDTGHSRDTLRQYRRLAQQHGLLEAHRPLPEPAQVEAALAPLVALLLPLLTASRIPAPDGRPPTAVPGARNTGAHNACPP